MDVWITSVFGICGGGIPTCMRANEDLPDDVPDDVPVADAVEQQRTTEDPVADEEASAQPPDEVPLEAASADWQEQLETVDLDSEFDEVDRP